MTRRIRFRFNYRKAIEALAWLAAKAPGIDFFHVGKVLYFADKMHLSRYGRPILGDVYIAMPHGPVPSAVYDMLKREPFFDPDLLREVEAAIQFSRPSGPPAIHPQEGREPNLRLFSRTDLTCLEESLVAYGSMPFAELREISHRERAYEEAPRNGEMNYALILGEDARNRDKLLEELEEDADSIAI